MDEWRETERDREFENEIQGVHAAVLFLFAASFRSAMSPNLMRSESHRSALRIRESVTDERRRRSMNL